MSNDNFEIVYERLERALELSDKFPSHLKPSVLTYLVDAMKKDGQAEDYVDKFMVYTFNNETLDIFMKRLRPSSNIERTLFIVYFLECAGVDSITQEHIEAGYDFCKATKPKSMLQNIHDLCSKRYNLLYMSDSNSYNVTTEGIEKVRRANKSR